MTDWISKFFDARTLIAEILLHRGRFHGSILLVEGRSDVLLFQRLVSSEHCFVLSGGSRDAVLGALTGLHDAGIVGVLGVVDRDFDALDFFEDVSENLTLTDENDVEMMMLHSPAFDDVLREYGSKDKISRVESGVMKPVREIVFERSAIVGALRVLSKREGLQLRFAGMKWKFEPGGGIQVDVDKQFAHILGRSSPLDGWDLGRLKEEVFLVLDGASEAKDFCNGHDVMRVLGRGLQKLFGSCKSFSSDDRREELERSFRLAYNWEHFSKTGTCDKMLEWSEESGFVIFD